MFQLNEDEFEILRSQFVTFRSDIRKYTPYVFTEQGVACYHLFLNLNILDKLKSTMYYIHCVNS